MINLSLDFHEYELGDLCNISSSKRIFAREYVDEGIPFYRGKEIIELFNNRDVSNELFITREKYESIKEKYGVPEEGDILLSSVGTLGVPYLVKNEKFYFKDGNLTWFKDFDSKLNNKFLYWWLQSIEAKYQINNKCIGSTQKALPIKTLEKFEINVPSIKTQIQIVDILESISTKIKTNISINKNLQALSKSLLKYHLEDFKPYLDKGIKNSEIGDIPKDWIVYEFDSISNIYNGYSYKGNELQQSNSAMVTIKNFNRDGSFRTDGFKEISYSNKVKDYHFVNEYDVLISCTDVTQDADIIGNCIILLDKKEYDDLIMSMDLVKIESKKKEINNFLLASILKSYRFKMHILGYVNGTTVLHLDKKGIKKFKLALPDDLSILKDLNDILENNYKQIAINQKEINKLQKLRDTLLPKLMSGEIDVSKINYDLE